MKIKKTYNGVVPNGKVLNKNSSSVTDTYSCDYINNLHNKGRLSLYKMPTEIVNTTDGALLLTGEITTTGGDLLINAIIGSFKTTSGNSYAIVRIDGSEKGRIIGTNKTDYSSESGTLIVSNIPAGTHTFDLIIRPNSGQTASVGPYNTITASVVEI